MMDVLELIRAGGYLKIALVAAEGAPEAAAPRPQRDAAMMFAGLIE